MIIIFTFILLFPLVSSLHEEVPELKETEEILSTSTHQNFVHISTGHSHTCAILDDGSVNCWGDNTYGQLGDGTTTDRSTPTQTSSLGTDRAAVAITAGGLHTCAILADGSVSCWGANSQGQLGDGTTTDRNTPTQTSSLGTNKTAVAINTGYEHTCVILDDGSVSCWGDNYYGQLGDETNTDRNTPIQIFSLGTWRTAVAITTGGMHTCAILDVGSVSCWGYNGHGTLGDGTTTHRNTPTQTTSLGTDKTAVAISAGYQDTCVILDDGSVSCWGRNHIGQLGDGTTTDRNTPTQTSSLGTGRTAVAISAGRYHTCAILDDGSGSCWGWNYYGGLGDGTTTNRNIPSQTPIIWEGKNVIGISAYEHTCVILDEGSVSCWGRNYIGQLGDGSVIDKHTPTQATYDTDGDGIQDNYEVDGCTDNTANNYNSEATDEDGSCDYDLGDDGVGDNAYLDGNSSNYCGENSVKTYLDSEGCTKIFRIESETFKKYSSITRVDSVSRGLNPTSQMVITPNGKVLAVLDDKSLLTLHFLDEKTSESSILSEEDSLAILHDNGRIVIISGSECIDALLKTPCLMGWKNSLTSPGNEHYWSGHVYFSEEYTPCKPGWSGLSHCHSGWFRIGDWNEFLSPSIMGIVSASPSLPPTPCPGCASPNGLYIADVAQIVTDWELIGGMDIKMDIVVSQTETWMSGDGEISRPGGLATVVGGYNFGSCGSIVCLISEMGDGVMFDFGGFTWSGDSSYLYAATSDSIVTIDMADKSYWEMDNRLSCDSSNSPPHFTGVSTPDGSRVIVPCGTSLIILDVDRNGDGDKDFPWFRVCCLLLITVGLIAYFVGNSESNQASFSLLIVMLLIMSSFSGCISDASNLDKDSEKLPSSIDLTIQGGIEAGKLVVFVSPGEDVPPESVDILLESAGSHQWFQLGHRSIGQLTGYDLAETTSFNTERVCSDGCSQISVKAFYRGQLISQQDISI